MNKFGSLPLCIVCLPVLMQAAETFTLVGPDCWKLKEDKSLTDKGAVIFKERLYFGLKFFEYEYSVRVVNEAGKEAVRLAAIPKGAQFQGRTMYPDGRFITFDAQKDLKEVNLAKGSSESKRKYLVPPGVTSDCIVQIRWKLSNISWEDFTSWEHRLLHPFPSLNCSIEFGSNLPVFTRVAWFGVQPKQEKLSDGGTSFVFTNLPAQEDQPFSARGWWNEPHFVMWRLNEYYKNKALEVPSPFWAEVCSKAYKFEYTENLIKGWGWNDFSKSLTAGLPKEPTKAAWELLRRLNQRLLNRDHLSFAEEGALPPKTRNETIRSNDLSASIKRGWTDSAGMHYLGFQLFFDAGLKPLLVQATDRDVRKMRVSELNYYQFDRSLIGLEVEGQLHVFDPGDRFQTWGMLHPDFQGTEALVVDTNTWSYRTRKLPFQSAETHRREYHFEHGIQEGELRTSMKVSFSGVPEYFQRKRYLPVDPKSYQERMKEFIKEEAPEWRLEKGEISGMSIQAESSEMRLELRKELEEGRRMEIPPFPGMISPVAIPDKLPESRKVDIILPYSRIHTARARLKIPAGYHWPIQESIERDNYFGKVSWKASKTEKDGSFVEVEMKVELSNSHGSSTQYASLKQFLDWIQEAHQRRILLERKS